MASEQDVTSDSLDSSVVDVPYQLMDYVKSSIIDYINKERNVSAKIHHVEGQSPKLVVSFERQSAQQPQGALPSPASDDLIQTNTIIVKNLPVSADEELLELFFESTKKQGGGPVKNVKILRDKNVAFVEFCENKAVETVMKKRPLKFGTTEIDIQPYKPLLKGSEIISNVDFKGLPNEFTEVLVKKHLDWLIHPVPVRDYEAEHFAFGSIKVGSRVVRGRDWISGNQDRGGIGTVTRVNDNGTVNIKWDYGATVSGYSMGKDGKYSIKLAN